LIFKNQFYVSCSFPYNNTLTKAFNGISASSWKARNVNIVSNQIETVTIFDVLGKQVLTSSFKNANKVQVNVANLQNGLYVVQTQHKNGNIATQKFVKQ
jgi:hypothetical protein